MSLPRAAKAVYLEVTLNRPKANAIDLKTSRLMGETFAAFRDDPETAEWPSCKLKATDFSVLAGI